MYSSTEKNRESKNTYDTFNKSGKYFFLDINNKTAYPYTQYTSTESDQKLVTTGEIKLPAQDSNKLKMC